MFGWLASCYFQSLLFQVFGSAVFLYHIFGTLLPIALHSLSSATRRLAPHKDAYRNALITINHIPTSSCSPSPTSGSVMVVKGHFFSNFASVFCSILLLNTCYTPLPFATFLHLPLDMLWILSMFSTPCVLTLTGWPSWVCVFTGSLHICF